MTRYRDKETGEVVEARKVTVWLVEGRLGNGAKWQNEFNEADFETQFEPVEDATAQPGKQAEKADG
ncbi:hypothetical protein [Pedomonas sp. V897]|uniref:hypothetical protein n=1 Tax=Pedomonas sp. V897 TaxID=3446482 RepID=UPI003EE1D35A